MFEGREDLGVRALNKWLLLLIFFSLGAQKPPVIQRGIVSEHEAIIYENYDFDSEQIARLPQNKVIVVSTKIYRPQNLFGSFYKVYLNKPQRVRGYISEVDIIPQYKRSQEGLVLNEAYQERENILKQVKPRKGPSQIQMQKPAPVSSPSEEKSEKTDSQQESSKEKIKNAVGFSFGWMSPLFEEGPYGFTPVLGGVHWLGFIPPLDLFFDAHLAISPLAPYEIQGNQADSGFIVEGQFFPLWKGFEGMSLGAGLAWKYESNLQLSQSEFNLGLGVSLNFIFHFTEALFGRLSSEYKYYFNEGEKQSVNFWLGVFYKV